ncbi:uncharacterized protein ARB_04611 [Trichophyton benhamiae CBS 112371]|uniref:Uncharacterized protein n=1 Tax=Arthroderma benhamiae (strain ATCC MYA-4681 / CBS 112371) TaxID=663331 RepID=D4AK10_ARTBC|nr:uncharacterized protein ARB_04611 [Trichophyton benhamiae CBS 112371]EFE37083.1 hypothetical protein ARB_04611 [Trichophyton benhamiae CBS 112371]
MEVVEVEVEEEEDDDDEDEDEARFGVAEKGRQPRLTSGRPSRPTQRRPHRRPTLYYRQDNT